MNKRFLSDIRQTVLLTVFLISLNMYTEQKKKFTHTLFSNISADTYPMKKSFILN